MTIDADLASSALACRQGDAHAAAVGKFGLGRSAAHGLDRRQDDDERLFDRRRGRFGNRRRETDGARRLGFLQKAVGFEHFTELGGVTTGSVWMQALGGLTEGPAHGGGVRMRPDPEDASGEFQGQGAAGRAYPPKIAPTW